jgi:hypothetical protein
MWPMFKHADRRFARGLIVLALLLCVCHTATAAESWWLNLRTTGYAYQSLTATDNTNDHFEGYQHLSGAASGLASGRLSVRMSARVADDLRYEADAVDASRLYAAQLIYKPTHRLQFDLGRRFIQEGLSSLTLDGLHMAYRYNRHLRATAWTGGRAPFDLAFDAARLDKDAAHGARLEFTPNRDLRLGFSLAHRKRDDQVSRQPLSFDGSATLPGTIRFSGRAAYDRKLESWRRIEGQVMRRQIGRLPEIRFQLLSRRPTVDTASWFSRFVTAERIRLTRLNLSRRRADGWGGEFEYQGTVVDDRSASRVGLAVLLPFGRLGLSQRQGDVGDDSGVYGEIRRRLTPWLRADVSMSHVSYTFLEDDPTQEERVVTAFSGRLRADLRPGLRVTAEIQRIETPLHDHDVRLLLGVNLSAAGGASRFGLNRREVRP